MTVSEKRGGDGRRSAWSIAGFAITIIVVFLAFGAYAFFYKFASFLIRDSVQKTLTWSSLIDMQIRLQGKQAANRQAQIANQEARPSTPATIQQSDNSDTPTLQQSDITTADWQTYRNEEYGFEVKYPAELRHDDPSGRSGYVSFGRPPYEEIDIPFHIDSICVFATGYEDSQVVTSTKKTVTLGANLFNEERVYVDGQPAEDKFSINFPVAIRKVGGKCNFVTVIFLDLNQGVIGQILSTFRFIK